MQPFGQEKGEDKMRIAWEGRELYCHISTKAGFDPVKTLYVCAPGADAASYEAAARFAQASGWREIAEQDGAVLVLPIVPHGWRAEDAGLLMEIYRGTRGSFPTQSGKSLYGRGGYLWCWETLIYAVGYEDGASFLGDASAACPSFLLRRRSWAACRRIIRPGSVLPATGSWKM